MPPQTNLSIRITAAFALVRTPSEEALDEVGDSASLQPVGVNTEDEAAPLPVFRMGMRLPVPTRGLPAVGSCNHTDSLSGATSHQTQ